MASAAMMIILFGLWLRPPGPGKVYHHEDVDLGGATSTALLMKRHDCLTLSFSEEDIGSSETGAHTIGRTYAIAVSRSVVSGLDEKGTFLIDEATGEKARAGDAIDGEILRMQSSSPLKMFMSLAWLYDGRCGAGVALIRSIERAHD
ncbi:hypothetical protein [Sphingomonas swuensis]|uniref:hypothetical protein n=1 Tax=Sphingomonas swuensis TaxID=977800 RepID=UPI0031D25646